MTQPDDKALLNLNLIILDLRNKLFYKSYSKNYKK